jgi:serine/threonine-protein kinase
LKFGRYDILEREEIAGSGFDALAREESGRRVRLWIGEEGSGTVSASRPAPSEALARLEKVYHAGLPRPLDALSIEGRAVFVVAPYEGETLRARLLRGELSIPDSLDVARSAGAALEKAHRAGIVHGCVREEEIFLTQDGRTLLLHVGFGAFLGARPPRAPEDASSGRGSETGDVFGLASVLFRLLAGREPFAQPPTGPLESRRAAAARAADIPSAPPQLPEGLPEGLRRFAARALAEDPAVRIRRASEFASDLGVIRSSWDTLAKPPPRPLVPFPPSLDRRLGLAAGFAAALVIVLCVRACSG